VPQLVPSLAIGMTMTADFATWIPDGPGVQSVLHGRYRWLVCVMTAEKEPHLSVARTATSPSAVQVVDLFCGVGGLTRGLEDSGINVVAGLDSDADCEYAYSVNNDARFVHANLLETSSDEIESMWSAGAVRVLVGCAPCQPYSKYSRGTSKEDPSAPVLRFAKYVDDLRPAVVSMENVPAVSRHPAFNGFLETLASAGYHISWETLPASGFGVPQTRKRLVLMASRLAPIALPASNVAKAKTVRQAIGRLVPISAGEANKVDPTHRASALSAVNLERIRNSRPGGTWRDWPDDLRAACHKGESGATFPAVYGRMEWDVPAPTVTTQFFGYGNGRFGHPVQDRAISLREGALLQTFPQDYKFEKAETLRSFALVGRHIGNAVPVALAKQIGNAINSHLEKYI